MEAWLKRAPELIETWMVRSPKLKNDPVMVEGMKILTREPPKPLSEDDAKILWNVLLRLKATGMPVPQ